MALLGLQAAPARADLRVCLSAITNFWGDAVENVAPSFSTRPLHELDAATGARVFQLYDPVTKKQIPRYELAVAAIQPGDFVQFSDGARFEVETRAQGGLDVVITTTTGEALRFPKYARRRFPALVYGLSTGLGAFDSLRDTREGYADLETYGVDTVRIDWERSLPEEYLRVEKFTLLFGLYQFMHPSFRVPPGARLRAIENDLVRWARSTWAFATIGDFHDDQLYYTAERGWVLLDWGFQHRRIVDLESDENVFEMSHEDERTNRGELADLLRARPLIQKPGLPAGMEERIRKAIRDERRKRARDLSALAG